MSKNVQLNKNGVTLEEFIRDNEVLLSSMAVFATIIFFSKDLSPHFIATILSFLIIGGLILISLEIWFKFPKQVTWRLFCFRYVLLWSTVGIIFSWLFEYRLFWDMFLFIPITLVSFTALSSSVSVDFSKISFIRKLFGVDIKEKTKLQKWMRAIAILSGIFISLYVGITFAFGTNSFLNLLKLTLPKI